VRNRYFDVLRALAIIRVVVYHATGWALLTIVFPAMGTMFALSGSLMATSLDRYGVRAVSRRARRLLPPLWAMAAVFVPLMVVTGLPITWRLLFWIVPLTDPPTNGWGGTMLGVVWYLRQYLWFVLLSPLALPVFRRWPVPSLVAPLGLLVAIELGLPHVAMLRDLAVYFGCWLLGFAHHDGMLQRLSRRVLLGVSLGMTAAGAAWFLTHPGPRGLDLNDIPIGDTLWSTGFVLLLLGWVPQVMPSHGRALTVWQPVSRLVTVLNRRAVTVYLWHQPAIVGLALLVGLLGWNLSNPAGNVTWLTIVAAGVVVSILAIGWVEDLAARRRPALIPAHDRGS
jgi:peptidoglycan/LPS O-acetylase OafA/YrhL